MANPNPEEKLSPAAKRVISIVFFCLLLDLLAFTLILPLFPRLVNHYVTEEQGSRSILQTLLNASSQFRMKLQALGGRQGSRSKADTVLLGGLLGSVFSLMQHAVSPWIGGLSDKYGRKPILLLTMIGNLASAVLWLFAADFGTFLSSRVVSGLSEGNVQLSIAMLSDVTTEKTRGSALVLVGLAFSLCFTFGPLIGAYFASRPISPATFSLPLNVYATPALLTIGILILETALLVFFLPETHKSSPSASSTMTTSKKDLIRLRKLKNLHCFFLLIFSGAEFTLSFATFDVLDYSNLQNGKLLGSVGILSALLQGGYVRKAAKTQGGSIKLIRNGLMSCCIALSCLALSPYAEKNPMPLLAVLSASLAYTSASVVNSLNAEASKACAEASRGKEMGKFRSAGQLGRAIGPLLSASLYYILGPTQAFSLLLIAMLSTFTMASRSGLLSLAKKDNKVE